MRPPQHRCSPPARTRRRRCGMPSDSSAAASLAPADPAVANRARPFDKAGAQGSTFNPDVQRGLAPAHRDLDARNEHDSRMLRGARGFLETVGGVVICQRNRVDPGAGRELQELRGRQQTIRARRMVVQVVVIQGVIVSKWVFFRSQRNVHPPDPFRRRRPCRHARALALVKIALPIRLRASRRCATTWPRSVAGPPIWGNISSTRGRRLRGRGDPPQLTHRRRTPCSETWPRATRSTRLRSVALKACATT